MHVLITGADGYIGRGVVQALERPLAPAAPSIRLTLLDRQIGRDVDSPLARCIRGDLTDPGILEAAFVAPVDCVIHLAAIVSGAAEADFELGRRVNLDATSTLLELARRQSLAGGPVPRLVFASSIAVYGTPARWMDDDTAPAPTLSYGYQKLIGELLVADYGRRGYVDGRAVRLPGVIVRPPMPNGALSAFMSDVIRVPLAGHAYECPVSPRATVWVTSLGTCVRNLLRAAFDDGEDWPTGGALQSPPLAVSIGAIVDAIAIVAGPAAAARVRYAPQSALERDFGSWPLAHGVARAQRMGFAIDESIEAIVRAEYERHRDRSASPRP
jgi:nucleoside-diphosphate-sugar epimerase